MHVYFSHISESTRSTVCGYLGTVGILNRPLCDKKDLFLRLDVSPVTSRATQVVPMRLHATGSSEESDIITQHSAG